MPHADTPSDRRTDAPSQVTHDHGPTALQERPDVIKPVLAVIALLGLIGISLWVMRPFIAPLIWAATIVIATWPLMRRLQGWLGGSRMAASTLMTLAVLSVFFVPLALAIVTVLENAETVSGWIRQATTTLPGSEPPAWLASLPLVGTRAADLWREITTQNLAPLFARITPHFGTLASQAFKHLGAIGAVTVEFLLTVCLCAVLYAWGEAAARKVRAIARTLAGERGVRTTMLAGASIRGVALGVVVTALIQAVLAGLGLALVGIPGAALLTALMLLLSIAQLGTLPVLIPATIWVFITGDTAWGVGLALWSVFVATMDNILRPWLIRQGADLPMLLIFAGVIGGLMAFGLIGLFIGPVVLAVTYTLLEAWIRDNELGASGRKASEDSPPG
jgi:predicted PurR-regulated permease PerM